MTSEHRETPYCPFLKRYMFSIAIVSLKKYVPRKMREGQQGRFEADMWYNYSSIPCSKTDWDGVKSITLNNVLNTTKRK